MLWRLTLIQCASIFIAYAMGALPDHGLVESGMATAQPEALAGLVYTFSSAAASAASDFHS